MTSGWISYISISFCSSQIKYTFKMTHRGRGCQEIRSSNDPFFQTTNSVYGIDSSNSVTNWKSPNPRLPRSENPTKETSETESYDFSFLYRKTSDDIGSKIGFKGKSTSEPSKAELARIKGQTILMNSIQENNLSTSSKIDASAVLANYSHNPKVEDPRYLTTNNEYGKRKPTVATFVAERNSRPQGFSVSFNNVKPKNSSLNTAITKSTVHPSLDPQFI